MEDDMNVLNLEWEILAESLGVDMDTLPPIAVDEPVIPVKEPIVEEPEVMVVDPPLEVLTT